MGEGRRLREREDGDFTAQRLGRALAIIDGAARGDSESARQAAGRKRARDDADATRTPDAGGAAARGGKRARAAGYDCDQ